MDGRYYFAVLRNDIERIREILEGGGGSNIVDLEGNTPLHIVSSKRRTDSQDIETSLQVARELIRYGADVNATNRMLRTPLMLAVRSGNCRMVEFLLQANANINNRDGHRNTAMHYALLFDSLPYREKGENTLQMQIIKTLLKFDPDINVMNISTRTPLMLAVACGRLSLVQILLKHKACVNIMDWQVESVLHHAFHCNSDMDILVELLRYGGMFRLINIRGQTPIDIYIRNLNYTLSKEADKAKRVFKIFIFLKNKLSSVQQETIERISSRKNCQLTKFIGECIDEFNKMLRDKLVRNYCVHSMALGGFLKCDESDNLPYDIFDRVFDKIIDGEYPIYCDLIFIGISKPYLNVKFAEVCLVGNAGREFLNFYIRCQLSFYLSHSEMLSMMVAFAAKNKWDATSHVWTHASLI